jgi:hypothetical protein
MILPQSNTLEISLKCECTGEELFLRYAWPCASDKLDSHKISFSDFSTLKILIEKGGIPKRALLAVCFQNAVKAYGVYYRKSDRAIPEWSFDSVADYWRHHHIHPDKPHKCDLIKGIVRKINGCIISVSVDEKMLPVKNIYNLPIQVGKTAYVHQHSVIEIMD